MRNYRAYIKKPRKRFVFKLPNARGEIRSMVAVLICLVLLFASLNGVLKAFSLTKNIGQNKWNSEMPFVVAMNTSPVSVFVLQQEPARAAFFTLDSNTPYISGNSSEPIRKLSQSIGEGNALSRDLSKIYGANVDHFIKFEGEQKIDDEQAVQVLKKWGSIGSLFKIVFGGNAFGGSDTNVSQIDQFRLWWQLKSVGTKNVDFRNFSANLTSVLTANGSKINVVDDEILNKEIKSYFESGHLVNNHFTVEVLNGSGFGMAAVLTSKMVESAGFEVERIENNGNIVEKCQIRTVDKKSFATDYLASTFDCDIFAVEPEEQVSDITLVVGKDIANRYFE